MVSFNSNLLGTGFARRLDQLNNRFSRAIGQISSGERITSFSVDAAGGAIANRLESAFRELSTLVREEQTAINRLQTEDAALGGINNDLQRIRDLQVQAQSGTVDAEGQAALQAEVDQLVQNVRDTVEETQFAGTPILEAGEELTTALEEGIDVMADPETTDALIAEVSAQRAEIGAEVNAMESRINEQMTTFENTLGSYSRLADTDIAQAVLQQVNSQILGQFAMGSLNSMFAFNRQNVQTLLGGL